MDPNKYIVSNPKEEFNSIQRVKCAVSKAFTFNQSNALDIIRIFVLLSYFCLYPSHTVEHDIFSGLKC